MTVFHDCLAFLWELKSAQHPMDPCCVHGSVDITVLTSQTGFRFNGSGHKDRWRWRGIVNLFTITSSFLSGNSQGPSCYVFNTKPSLYPSVLPILHVLLLHCLHRHFTTRVLPRESGFCTETCELYELLLSESESQLLGTSTMLDKRLLSSTITTSCSPFTYTYIGDKNRF